MSGLWFQVPEVAGGGAAELERNTEVSWSRMEDLVDSDSSFSNVTCTSYASTRDTRVNQHGPCRQGAYSQGLMEKKWQPTPVFLPGESQGRGSLVGCRLWGRTELDTTEAT